VAGTDLAAALERLDEITRRLRRECPWDREQDERSIVPHTVEEAYELADAAHSGDDASCSTSWATCCSRSTSSRCCSRSAAGQPRRGGRALPREADPPPPARVRRRAAETAGDVVRNWNQIKRDDERGGEIFGTSPRRCRPRCTPRRS
jgi:XTP/dITP diphosphohydrolase/tetrapyrrole methylase family protein/MazG family protein/ATP diphosphatase